MEASAIAIPLKFLQERVRARTLNGFTLRANEEFKNALSLNWVVTIIGTGSRKKDNFEPLPHAKPVHSTRFPVALGDRTGVIALLQVPILKKLTALFRFCVPLIVRPRIPPFTRLHRLRPLRSMVIDRSVAWLLISAV